MNIRQLLHSPQPAGEDDPPDVAAAEALRPQQLDAERENNAARAPPQTPNVGWTQKGAATESRTPSLPLQVPRGHDGPHPAALTDEPCTPAFPPPRLQPSGQTLQHAKVVEGLHALQESCTPTLPNTNQREGTHIRSPVREITKNGNPAMIPLLLPVDIPNAPTSFAALTLGVSTPPRRSPSAFFTPPLGAPATSALPPYAPLRSASPVVASTTPTLPASAAAGPSSGQFAKSSSSSASSAAAPSSDDKTPKEKANMSGHEKTAEDCIACPVCARLFATKSNMKRHVKMVHEKLKPYQCSQCSKVFVQMSGLKRHKKRAHEEE